MLRRLLVLTVFCLAAALGGTGFAVTTAPAAHADSLIPCPYPFTGLGVVIRLGAEVVGGFCDGPTEVNGTHMHWEFGGATVAGGGVGLAPVGGLTFGGILGGGFGGGGQGFSWRCPDNTPGPQPNPPGKWKDYLVVRVANNSCIGHMTPAGPTSAAVEADQGPPGYQDPTVLPPIVPGPVMAEPPEPEQSTLMPTVTNPGQGNPDDLPE